MAVSRKTDTREGMVMSVGEIAYLVLVIGAFLLFTVVLGWASSNRSSRPAGRPAVQIAPDVRAQPS